MVGTERRKGRQTGTGAHDLTWPPSWAQVTMAHTAHPTIPTIMANLSPDFLGKRISENSWVIALVTSLTGAIVQKVTWIVYLHPVS